MNELTAVGEFENRIEAEIAQGLLTDAGIESIVKADDCGGMLMGVSLIRKGGVKIIVSVEMAEKAQDVLSVLSEEE